MLRVASIFGQILHEIPRTTFESLVRSHRAERFSKGFSTWTQLVAMVFSQLARADSLREICHGLATTTGKLVHLGLRSSPCRSTLSYANAHRPAKLFEDLFFATLDRFRRLGHLGHHKPFRFKNKLLTLDSTTVTLCLALFPWASYQRAKGGIKLHVLLNGDDYVPEYVVMSEGRRADLRIAQTLSLPRDSIVVMDRAYIDFDMLERWTKSGVYWVTRSKTNLEFFVHERRPVPKVGRILRDEVVVRMAEIVTAGERFRQYIRRIVVKGDEPGEEITLLTNHMGFGATTISRIYRHRWTIEVFFRTLKQNLKIKTFVGTSENALRIQIWTALLVLLVLKWLHHVSAAGWSISNLAYLLRMNLFTYRDLKEWLANPLATPALLPASVQQALPFPDS
jgi:hypothetical protein